MLADMHASRHSTTAPVPKGSGTVRRGILFESRTGDQHLDEHLEHVRKVDWASTSLGPLESWPQDLIQLCHISLLDPQPRLFILGTDRVLFYNGAYSQICGDKHPHILGQDVVNAWSDLAQDSVSIPLETVESTGRQVEIKDLPLLYERNGFPEEVYLSWTVIPLAGSTPGFYVSLTDVTETKLAEERRVTLRALDTAWNAVKDPRQFWQSIPQSLALDPSLFPFAFLYVASSITGSGDSIDTSSELTHIPHFVLEGATGQSDVTSNLPGELYFDHFEPFSHLRDPTLIQPDENSTPKSIRSLLTQRVILCPIRSNGSENNIAYLHLGINPNRPYNDAYQDWMNNFVKRLGNAVTSVLQSEEERRKHHYRATEAAREKHLLATALATRDREAIAVNDQFQSILKVVDMAGVGIYEYDIEGRLLYANSAFRAMAGCSPEMINNDTLAFLDLTYPEDTEYLMSQWNCAVSGTPCTIEMRYKSADGLGTWALAAVIPVLENGVVTRVSGCITNIHDTKLREAESKQRLLALERARSWEQRFANFAELAPVAIYFGSQIQDSLSYCNRAWFEITGHSVVPFEQINWASVVYEEDLELVRNNLKQVLAAEKAVSVQFRLKRSWFDGNGVAIGPVWVTSSALPEYREDGSVKGVIGTMLDISALKFAETVQAMKAQEAMEAKRQSLNFIDMTSHEIRNPLGAVFHCSDAIQDTLTEMKALADNLASTTKSETGRQLQELIASGVDSINTIISCSAHQKRIVDDILVLSKLDSNLLQINPSAVKVTTLLKDVGKMFETEAQRSDVQLETYAHASLDDLAVDWAMLDSGRVQQVLINIVGNAFKFTKKRTRRQVNIRIGASQVRPSENVLPDIDFVVAHSLHESIYDAPELGSRTFYLWFTVEDTGPGMTADERSRIFARFRQGTPRTETEYGGSGLGLFISRELSELQGGEIGVSSELDIGSTFAFFIKTCHTEIPITALNTGLPGQSRQQQSDDEMTDATKAKLSILVVEDNAVNRRVLSKQLTKHEYEVHIATNGIDALNFLRSTKYWRGNTSPSASTLSVILMDIEMPLMDGLTATKQIRQYETEGKLTGHVPIIAVSANARAEQTNMAMEAGMDDSISKPFRIVDLVPKIERLAGWT